METEDSPIPEIPIVDPKSSVKVTKNSKGYNWEVKVYNDDADIALNKMIQLELKCQELYGEKLEE